MAQVLDAPPRPAAGFSPSAHPTLALFLVSVLGLFLELMLIRWVSTEIRIFAYLQNTVLVVCILGLGMGCWDCRKPFALRDVLMPLGVLTALLAVPQTRIALGRISSMFNGFSDLLIWENDVKRGWDAVTEPATGLALTLLLMVLMWDTFVPVGRLLGRLLADHPRPVWAYSVNVAGSLAGIWVFVALSAVGLPPVAWFAAFAALAIPFAGAGGRGKAADLGLLAGVVGLGVLAGWEPGALETRWSPYQKLTLSEVQPPEVAEALAADRTSFLSGRQPQFNAGVGQYLVGVNNTGYQVMIDLDPARLATADPKRFPPAMRGYSQYDLPARFHPNPRKVLIVGAGTGNDAAGALRNGAGEVVAVEIDPTIIELGRRFHPEQPYSDPRVRVVNDDARSFFATCHEKFDVIAFGLLDSHTTTAMTNARLDHYVYTRESIRHAASLLNDGGVVVLSFEAQKPYITDRMARVLGEEFGRPPLAFVMPVSGYGWGGAVFVAGDQATIDRQLAADPKLAGLVRKWQAENPVPTPGTARVTTDDWPYIYLERPMVPVLYYLLAGLLVVLFARGVKKLGAPHILRGWGRPQWHFFFLGAAFMLLEVQNVSKAAVVLGNTWDVNAVIISGILAMVLLANGLSAAVPRLPVGVAYAGLVGSCFGLYFLDLSTFAFLPYPTKALTVGLLTSLPMLFSGVVFVRSFAAADRKDLALGANLFGSLVGALLQTVTFVVGVKALLLIVAALYVAALLTRPKGEAVAAPRPEPATA